MLKKTFTALAALGIAGTLSLAPTAPAQALGWCNDARHAQSDWCLRKAERKVRWDAFWAGLFDKRDRGVVRDRGWRLDRRDTHAVRKDRRWRLYDRRDRRALK